MTAQAPTPEARARSRLLSIWKAAYYKGEPLVEDSIYDYHEKKQMEEWPEDPELQKVGGIPESDFKRVAEGVPMLSLKKTYDPNELLKFVGDRAIIAQLKIDGMSLELRYKNGYLVQAVSRGRGGELGFDITANALFVKNVPHFIEDFTGEIRGEIVQTYEDFESYKLWCDQNGEKTPSHPRNVATGTMQQKDPLFVSKRKLRFIAYILVGLEERFPTEEDVIFWLKEKGFEVPRCSLYRNACVFTNKINEQLQTWLVKVKQAPYPCDGVVISFNDRKYKKELGNTITHPNGSRAFKWEDETADVKVLSIEWNTGRTGEVSPVGIIEETELSGAKINRVTLHNVGYVYSNNIKPGSVIKIIRSGEIIPKHLETLSSPDGNFSIPKECPSCGSSLKEQEGVTTDSVSLLCQNPDCNSQKFERILHYVKMTDMDHLGSGILEGLFKQGYIKSIPDLYLLPAKGIEAAIINGKSLGRRRAKKISVSIEKASVLTLPKFIAAIGVLHLGKSNAEKVCNVFNSIDQILNATVEDLSKVESFASTRAQVVYVGLQAAKPLIESLKPLVRIKEEGSLTLPKVLSGLRFVVTGSFSEENPRKEIENLIKESGGLLQTSPNKYTSYLIKGEGGGSKAEKARYFNIKTLNEQGFFELIAERSAILEEEEEETSD